MIASPIERDEKRWANTGRRWTAQLAVWLVVNFSLVTLAVCGYGKGATKGSMATLPAADQMAASGSMADVVAEIGAIDDQRALPANTPLVAPAPSQSLPPVVVDQSPSQQAAAPGIVGPAAGDAPSPDTTIANSQLSPVVSATTDASPPAVAVDAADQAAEPLLILNPPATRGAVHYLVDGESFSLLPGEYHRLEGSRMRSIAFHQGDDFGLWERLLGNGAYVFGLADNGWELTQPEASTLSRLLRICRPTPLSEHAARLDAENSPPAAERAP